MTLFVALEGIAGVGKSTTTRLLAERLNAKVFPALPDPFKPLRKSFSCPDQVDARFCFYLSAVIVTSDLVKETTARGQPVVLESFIYRTIASHMGMGASFRILTPKIYMPTHIFFLKCTEGERKRRLAAREMDPWNVLAETKAQAILDEYGRFEMPTIDTTEQSPEEVVERILTIVRR